MSDQENLLAYELRKRVLQLKQDDEGITLNEYAGPVNHHRRFCSILGISGTAWAKAREKQISETGKAQAYMKAELTDRILSTNGIKIPDFDIIDVTDDLIPTGPAAAAGPAVPGTTATPSDLPSMTVIPMAAAAATNKPDADIEPGADVGTSGAFPPQEGVE